jgi:cystathionine beta-lyase
MADLCLRRDVTIISDEIHCDLVYPGSRHIPIAALAPEVGARTITLMAPSKTFNIPGLGFSFAIIEDAGLRKAFQAAMAGIVPHVNIFGYVAALAAYTKADDWLAACCQYLQGNRDYLAAYIAAGKLPGVTMAAPEATYLAWLDCRGLDLDTDPFRFFLKRGRVALSNGASFGRGGEGFARLNFGCPRATLEQGLARMQQALHARA